MINPKYKDNPNQRSLTTLVNKLPQYDIHIGLSTHVLKLSQIPLKDKLSTFEGLFTTLEVNMDICSPPQENALRLILESPFKTLNWHIDVSDLESLKVLPPEFILFLNQLGHSEKTQTLVLSLHSHIVYSTSWLSVLHEHIDSISYPCLIESSHRSWKTPKVQAHLLKAGVEQVSVDAPRLFGIIKDTTYISSSCNYLRLLGRNSRNWFESIPAKCEYKYSSDEIDEISQRIQRMRQESRNVIVIFGTHPFENAYSDAQMLVQLLSNIIEND